MRIVPNPRYIKAALAAMGLETCKIAPTPSSAGKEIEDDDDEPLDAEQASTFRTVTGILAYFGVGRRDVQCEINKLACQMREPKASGWTRANMLLRFPAGTIDAFIWIEKPKRGPLRVQHCGAQGVVRQ